MTGFDVITHDLLRRVRPLPLIDTETTESGLAIHEHGPDAIEVAMVGNAKLQCHGYPHFQPPMRLYPFFAKRSEETPSAMVNVHETLATQNPQRNPNCNQQDNGCKLDREPVLRRLISHAAHTRNEASPDRIHREPGWFRKMQSPAFQAASAWARSPDRYRPASLCDRLRGRYGRRYRR